MLAETKIAHKFLGTIEQYGNKTTKKDDLRYLLDYYLLSNSISRFSINFEFALSEAVELAEACWND